MIRMLSNRGWESHPRAVPEEYRDKRANIELEGVHRHARAAVNSESARPTAQRLLRIRDPRRPP